MGAVRAAAPLDSRLCAGTRLVLRAYGLLRRDRELHRRPERTLPTVHLDQDRRRNPHQSNERSRTIVHTTLALVCVSLAFGTAIAWIDLKRWREHKAEPRSGMT